MNYSKLNALRFVLSEMNKREGHGLGYEINKNLHTLNKGLSDFEERLEKFKSDNVEKDESGEPIRYAIDMKGDYALDDKGERVKLDEKSQAPSKMSFPESRKAEIEAELQKFDSEDISVELLPIKEADFEKALKSGCFDGLDVYILFDNLIKGE